jgi:hypothetical protein
VSDGLVTEEALGLSTEGQHVSPPDAFTTVSVRRPVGTSASDTGCPTYRVRQGWPRVRVDVLRPVHTRSTISAIPCPTPMHIVHSA